jgi:hypothetical protein
MNEWDRLTPHERIMTLLMVIGFWAVIIAALSQVT